jgi:hypothetical protein
MQFTCRQQRCSPLSSIFRLIAVLLVFAAAGAWGGSAVTQIQLEAIERSIERPLPSLDVALGFTSVVDKRSRYLVVGAFVETGAGALSIGTKALAFYLSALLQGRCGVLSIEPPYLLSVDSRGEYQEVDPGATVVNERLLSRLRPDLLLHGQIAQNRETVTVNLQIFNRRTGDTVQLPPVKGDAATLDHSLAVAVQSVLDAFCADAKVVTPPSGSLAVLSRIWASPSADGEPNVTALRDEFNKGGGGYPLALRYLKELWGNAKGDTILTAATASLQRFPEVLSINIFANYLLITVAPRFADLAAFERLRAACASMKNDFSCQLALLDAYRIEQLMYHSPQGDFGTVQVISGAIDHHEGTARAIALGVDLVERYPNNFRSRFHLAMSLSKYASLVRGTAYWRNLSQDQQRRYSAIQEQATAALKIAGKIHPQDPWIHEELMHMETASQVNMMDSFRRASALAPYRARIYQMAYNYAGSQWGGTKAMKREIYETSKRNNPNAEWPENLRKVWAKELTFWRIDNGFAWLALAMFIGAAIAGCLHWRRPR